LISRCVQLARDDERHAELSLALVAQGKTQLRLGALYEAQQSFALALATIDSVAKETSELFVTTSWRLAESLPPMDAVAEYRKAREEAGRAKILEGLCDFKLGVSLQKIGEFQEASDVLQRALDYGEANNDRVLVLESRAALAETCEALRDFKGAEEHLEILLEQSGHDDLKGQSIGCLRLGLLLLGRVQEEQNTFGLDDKIDDKINRAVQLLENHYDLCRQITHNHDMARLVLGVARATNKLPNYFDTILHNNNKLKAWKCQRTPL